mgnify:CR=1 FL=1
MAARCLAGGNGKNLNKEDLLLILEKTLLS